MTSTTVPIVIEKIKVEPTHLAQVCPVCNGWTTVKHGSLPCGACYDSETQKSRGYVLIPVRTIKEGQHGK